ncbi:hypothetical protein D9M73_76590 [compost metagenome]
MADHAAAGIGVADGGLGVAARQPPHIVDAAHVAGGIGVADDGAAEVVAHQAARIVARCCHGTTGIAFADAAGVKSHQSANRAGPRNAAGGIGVADAAAVQARQPAGGASRNAACGISRVYPGGVPPHQPARIEDARNAARGIATADAGVAAVLAHQPARIVNRGYHRAAGVAVANAAGVEAHQPAHVGAAVDAAAGIGIADIAATAAHQPAHIGTAAHAAGGIGIADAAAVAAHKPANANAIDGLAGIDAGHGAGGVAAADAARVATSQPADAAQCRDTAGGMGIDDAASVAAHQPADSAAANDAAAHQADVAQHAAGSGAAEQAHVRGAARVDDQLADGVPQPGESAGEGAAHQRAGVSGAAGIQVLGQRVVSAQAGAVNGVQPDHAVNQRVVGAVDSQRGVDTAERDRGLDLVVTAVVEHQAAAGASGRDGPVDVDVAAGRQGQHAAGTPAHGIVDVDVSSGATRALGVQDGDRAVVGQLRGERRASHVTAAGRNREVGRVYQPAAALLAEVAGRPGGDHRAVGNFDVRRAGFNEAAIAAVGGRSIERTRDVHRAIAHVAHQQDATGLVQYCFGLDHAGVIDRGTGQAVHGLGREQHLPAIGLDELLVFGQGVDGTFVDAVAQQRAVVQVECDLVARRKQGGAQAGCHHTFIANFGRQQRQVAAGDCSQATLVDHRARTTRICEDVVAGHEVGVTHAECRGDQAADIDL